MDDHQGKITNETHFLGTVNGQIHAGSGNINIGRNTGDTPTKNKTADPAPGGATESDKTAAQGDMATRDVKNHTLFHGPVSGQLHTGSGDLNINRFVGDALVNDRAGVPAQAGVDANGDVVVVEPETRIIVAKVPQQEAYHRIAEEANDTRRQKQQIYDHNRRLARQWAFFSFLAAILGFLVILGGIVTLLAGIGNTTAAVITSIASIIPEAAAVLFFRQAEAAHKRVDNNQKELIETGTTHRLIALVETIDDSETQRRLKEKIIMQTFGLSAKGQEVPAPISGEEKQDL